MNENIVIDYNDEQFYDTLNIANKMQQVLHDKKMNIFKFYKSIDRVNLEVYDMHQVFDFTNIMIEFPFYFQGNVPKLPNKSDVIFGPNVGGTQIQDGNYTIPLLIQIK